MRGNTRTSRIAAYAASTALAISGTVLAVTPAEAVTYDPIGENQGATWLSGELTHGLMHYPDTGFGAYDDYGLSIDAAFALDAAGGHDAAVDAVADAIADHVNDYITGEAFGDAGSTYAGAVAKTAVLAQQTGASPTAFGGVNLVTRLESRVSATAPIVGRLEDATTFGDNANALGQAFASRSLFTAGSSKSADVTAFLLKQQCTSGYFRLKFTSSKTASNQSCVVGTDAPDTDATATAVIQLASQAGSNSAVATAITTAKTWLANQQKGDGSWGGGPSTEGSNANSTGLAALALGGTADSEQAAGWLRAHQATDYDACDKLAGDRGALAYDNTGLAAGRSNGITTATMDQWRRASAQAVPALAYLPQDTSPSAPILTGPIGYLKAGTRQILVTNGVASGDQLCLTGVGAAVQGVASTTRWQKVVTLPGGTRTRVYTVRDSFGHSDTAAVKVLGRTRLAVTKSQFRVKRGHYVTAMVSGLLPSEWSRIFYKGRLVRSGKATSTGRFLASFRVGRAKGKKLVVGYGQFTDIRRGATTIKVVR